MRLRQHAWLMLTRSHPISTSRRETQDLLALPSFRGPRSVAGFRVSGPAVDLFRNSGMSAPCVSRTDPHHNDSPVFGLAGFVLPVDEVRGFGTWFFQRKCELLESEIRQTSCPVGEEGAHLLTVRNAQRYRRVRGMADRLLNKIERLDGFEFYVGVKKMASPNVHNSDRLYTRVLLEAIKRIDQFCAEDCDPTENFVLALDEHALRPALITEVSRSMSGGTRLPRRLACPLETVPGDLEHHRRKQQQSDRVRHRHQPAERVRQVPDEVDFAFAAGADGQLGKYES